MGRPADKPLWQALNQRSHEEGSLLLAEKWQRQQMAARAPTKVESSGELGNLNLIPAHRPSNEVRENLSPNSSPAAPWGFAPLGEPAALLQGRDHRLLQGLVLLSGLQALH